MTKVWNFLPNPEDAAGSLRRAIVRVSGGVEKGLHCPCCGQYAKLYPRYINPEIAAWLTTLVSAYEANRTWYHVGNEKLRQVKGGDYAKLLHWRLIKSHPTKAGYWKPTKRGRRFASGRLRVKRKALIYDGKFVGLTGRKITIDDAYKTKFSREEILRNPNVPPEIKKKKKRTVRRRRRR